MGMRITKLIFVQTGTYGDQFYRPYEAEYDGVTQKQFMEITANQTRVTAVGLAGIAGNIVKPTSHACGMVDIPQGWGNDRLRFCMEVEVTSHAGGRTLEYITGYTDTMGATLSGNIDPQMRLFINNSVTISAINERNSAIYLPTDISHVLTSPRAASQLHYAPPNIDLMTPQDLMQGLMRNTYGGNVNDLRRGFGVDEIRKSRRSNGISTNYLARSINAINAAELQDDNPHGSDLATIYSIASDSVSEGLISNDVFLTYLEDCTSFARYRSVAYGELVAGQPGLDDIAVITFNRSQNQRPVASRGQSEYWNTTTPETVAAATLSYSVPSVMMELMLTELTFRTTNMTVDGSIPVDIYHAMSFASGINLQPYLQRFIDRFVSEIMPDISHRNQVGINLMMDIDVLGDTRIEIQYNGGPSTPYVIPSFSDARFSPIVTPDDSYLDRVITAVGTMANNLGSALQPEVSNFSYNTQYHAPVDQPRGLILPTPRNTNHGTRPTGSV